MFYYDSGGRGAGSIKALKSGDGEDESVCGQRPDSVALNLNEWPDKSLLFFLFFFFVE